MFSRTTEYALRALAALACSSDDETVLARDLSPRAGVSISYLSKILRTLGKAGIVHASSGRGGGYRLAQPAEHILLVNVVELFEGVKTRPDCLFESGRECSDDNPCGAHESFKGLRKALVEFLESTTIADIEGLADRGGVPAGGLRSSKAGGRK
jgi:Rrf2 family protein